MDKLKVSCVNYLNSIPYVSGLTDSDYAEHFELQLDFPAETARKMINGEVDIALVPVAVLPELQDVEILNGYGIASDGPVSTVKIFSHKSIEELHTLLLDYQSRTSAMLCQILLKEYWQTTMKAEPAYKSFQKDIIGDMGGLVIGDRAIRLQGDFPYEYDLGEVWKKWTGQPFVFAVWVCKTDIPESMKSTLQSAFEYGLSQKKTMIDKYKHLNNAHFDVTDYLNKMIIHKLDESAQQGMSLFLTKIKNL